LLNPAVSLWCVTVLLACQEAVTPVEPVAERIECDAGSSVPQNVSPASWPACYSGADSTDNPRRYGCAWVGVSACTPRWLAGAVTPSGRYHCNCDFNTVDVADAGNCEAALEAACGIDLPAPP
jgi:hypothetical protein